MKRFVFRLKSTVFWNCLQIYGPLRVFHCTLLDRGGVADLPRPLGVLELT